MFELKTILGIALGAMVGYLYYRVVGCRSGACPLSSNPWISTLYGGFMGFTLTQA